LTSNLQETGNESQIKSPILVGEIWVEEKRLAAVKTVASVISWKE